MTRAELRLMLLYSFAQVWTKIIPVIKTCLLALAFFIAEQDKPVTGE